MNTLDILAASHSTAPSRLRLVFNFLAFQCGWFACVLGSAHGWPLTGSAIATAIVAAHVSFAARPREELKLIAIAVMLGALCDSALLHAGWLTFTSGTFVEGFAPAWILAMWALFATTLNVSMAWLKGRWLTAAAMGAVAGPLAYWAGVRLGAVTFTDPWFAVAALAVEWGLMMPLLLVAASRFDGVRARA